MKNRIVLTMIYDIKLFPPVMSICNILSELNYEIVYIGGCSDATIEKALTEKNYVGSIEHHYMVEMEYKEYFNNGDIESKFCEYWKRNIFRRTLFYGYCILKQSVCFLVYWNVMTFG